MEGRSVMHQQLLHSFMARKRNFGLLMFLFCFCCIPNIGNAQIRFVHNTKEVRLSASGAETIVKVILVGPKRIDLPLDVELVRDGQLTHVVVPSAIFNHFEDPTYTFSVASPRAGMVYRFKVRDADGKTWTSQYYWTLQKCQDNPHMTTDSLEIRPDGPTKDALDMALRAQVLEKELLRTTLAEKQFLELSKILEGK